MYIHLVLLIILSHLKLFLSLKLSISFSSLDASNPTCSKIKTLFAWYAKLKHFEEDDNLFEDGKEFPFIAYVRNQDEDVPHFFQLHADAKPFDPQHEEENNLNCLSNDLKQAPDSFG